MDLNKDGNVDILSGSYSRLSQPMAGEFHVFYGTNDGAFKAPVVLNNGEGQPLEISVSLEEEEEEGLLDVICTRPYAVDLNDDGNLDIVSGNMNGSFALFLADADGTHGTSTILTDIAGNRLMVNGGHSDPTFIDWDGDGDLDMLSGAGAGGAYFFENVGDKISPAFMPAKELVAPPKELDVSTGYKANLKMNRIGLKVSAPQALTRVIAVDYNKDGKLDLLVGDFSRVVSPVNGLSVLQCKEKLKEWNSVGASITRIPQEEQGEFMKRHKNHQKKLNEFIRVENTGFVWLYLGV